MQLKLEITCCTVKRGEKRQVGREGALAGKTFKLWPFLNELMQMAIVWFYVIIKSLGKHKYHKNN